MIIKKFPGMRALLFAIIASSAVSLISCTNEPDKKADAGTDSSAGKKDSSATPKMDTSSKKMADTSKAAMDTASTRPIKNPT